MVDAVEEVEPVLDERWTARRAPNCSLLRPFFFQDADPAADRLTRFVTATYLKFSCSYNLFTYVNGEGGALVNAI